MKEKTICFEFQGVIRSNDSPEPVEHILPALYKAIKKYDKVFVWDPNESMERIKSWLRPHDLGWRECCLRIVRDEKQEMNLHRLAELTLMTSPLCERLHFPWMQPDVDIYVHYCQKSIMVSRKCSAKDLLDV